LQENQSLGQEIILLTLVDTLNLSADEIHPMELLSYRHEIILLAFLAKSFKKKSWSRINFNSLPS